MAPMLASLGLRGATRDAPRSGSWSFEVGLERRLYPHVMGFLRRRFAIVLRSADHWSPTRGRSALEGAEAYADLGWRVGLVGDGHLLQEMIRDVLGAQSPLAAAAGLLTQYLVPSWWKWRDEGERAGLFPEPERDIVSCMAIYLELLARILKQGGARFPDQPIVSGFSLQEKTVARIGPVVDRFGLNVDGGGPGLDRAGRQRKEPSLNGPLAGFANLFDAAWPQYVELLSSPPRPPDPSSTGAPPPLFRLIPIASGSIAIGSGEDDHESDPDERPRHLVSIEDLRIADTPVTHRQYATMVSRNVRPGSVEPDAPETGVSWMDAIHFCNRLSDREEFARCYRIEQGEVLCDWSADGYRLPTEAEWECAARAGTESPRFFEAPGEGTGLGLEHYAWFADNAGRLCPVALLPPNPWGFFDLLGNVWEWCWDVYAPYSEDPSPAPPGSVRGPRVLRGGAFDSSARFLRASCRSQAWPEERRKNVGFRCVRAAGLLSATRKSRSR